ncbi:MAG TPA: winged helix-turn-helix domain-containing protein [Verrucomicrobiae bacterium]|nr:winged helix-turn-helix domain-containing protein [Verrucomicrobiae bacterium]
MLDERSLELTVGGVLVHLERKPLEVLLYLLSHAGEVVTKEELAEHIWPGRILTESVLTRCMSLLRQVLKDDDRALIRTVHGFGYRLVAEVRIDATPASTPPVFAFKAGERPPLRPQWRLIERLGTGGHGEAWLARHEGTQHARVFKFALDAQALVSLKREITLYRLLHDSLGARAAVARVLDWNLEETPYFIETEYVDGRDLSAWADARGGLASFTLEQRLDLVAQIAEALAMAHSVGVLHKDLKPGNVLVEGSADVPTIKLCDFGSGGMLDLARLEALGITNLGFTKTATADQVSGGTPLYLAPELIAGQPFTVAADVYALGVMMYQMVVADLRQPLAPGWELKVEDELLREDIAAAAAGEPARRLADAAQLATRLRSLESRRSARAIEQAARERAERTQRILKELRRTRAFALAVLILAVAAIVGGVTAYRARNDAIAARATTQAVNDFLTEGVLSVDPAAERPKDASYESLLSRAATQVDLRFKGQPEATASIHWLLGRRFQEVSQLNSARVQYEKAAALLPELRGRAALPALLSQDRLIPIYFDSGRRDEAIAISRTLLANWTARYGHTNLSTYLLRSRIARMHAYAGDLNRAEAELVSILKDMPSATPLSGETQVVLKEWLSVVLATDTSRLRSKQNIADVAINHVSLVYAGYLGEFAEDYRQSEVRYREAFPVTLRVLGDGNVAALARTGFAVALMMLGQFEEARHHIQDVEEFFNTALPAHHWLRAMPKFFSGRLALEQRHFSLAKAELEAAMSACIHGGCSPRVTEDVYYELGRAHDQLGDLERAIEIYRKTLNTYELLRGPDNLGCLKRRLSLVDALRRTGKTREPFALLSDIEPGALAALPAQHLVAAEFHRVQGLLWLADGQRAKGQKALEEALRVFEFRLAADHWRTQQVRMEMGQAAES